MKSKTKNQNTHYGFFIGEVLAPPPHLLQQRFGVYMKSKTKNQNTHYGFFIGEVLAPPPHLLQQRFGV